MNKPTTSSQGRTVALARHQANASRYADILRQFTGELVPVKAAVISTIDGILITSLEEHSQQRPAQLAAMSSSLLAVAAAAGREVGHTHCDRLIIESPTGTLLVKPVGRKAELALCIALPPDCVLGKALWATEEISKGVNAV